MAISLTNLKNKVENNGENDQGVLRAEEFNDLVQAVIENQQSVKNVITSINYNNVTYDTVIDGVLQMKVQDTSDRITGYLSCSGRMDLSSHSVLRLEKMDAGFSGDDSFIIDVWTIPLE